MTAPAPAPRLGPGLDIVDVTTETWPLFEGLLGPRGLQGGCWCSYFRISSREFETSTSTERKAMVRSVVEAGRPFGLVAVRDGEPQAWVAVAPRSDYGRITRSAIARTDVTDLAGVWSVVCFYARRGSRGQGVTTTLLEAATAYARRGGARVVEGYPIDAAGRRCPAGELYHGTVQAFLAAGFDLVERRGERRALVRKTL